MRLLLTNDDGILSPILQAVAAGLAGEHDVVVVAPATDQSGKSHSFTHGPHALLHYQQVSESPFTGFQVQGTPSDCVKFAITYLYRGRPFDLVLSGINLGENAGISSIYSGTVAGAREAALWGIPGLAISLWRTGPEHVEYALTWVRALLRKPSLLPRPGEFFNVNFPSCPIGEIAGSRITTMSEAMFTDAYVPETDAHGVTGYRLQGQKPANLFVPGTDDHALAQNFIAITPMRIAQFYPEALSRLQSERESLDHVMRASLPALRS